MPVGDLRLLCWHVGCFFARGPFFRLYGWVKAKQRAGAGCLQSLAATCARLLACVVAYGPLLVNVRAIFACCPTTERTSVHTRFSRVDFLSCCSVFAAPVGGACQAFLICFFMASIWSWLMPCWCCTPTVMVQRMVSACDLTILVEPFLALTRRVLNCGNAGLARVVGLLGLPFCAHG